MGRKLKKVGVIFWLCQCKQKLGVVYYYYDLGGKLCKEMLLGSDYVLVIKKWVELEGGCKVQVVVVLIFCMVSDFYCCEVIIIKVVCIQEDNCCELDKLLGFFDDLFCFLEVIILLWVWQYLMWWICGGIGMVCVNCEKVLFLYIWNFVCDKGYMVLLNFCVGIKGFKEIGWDVYIEDDQYQVICVVVDMVVQDVMDLVYLIGQWLVDVLSLIEMDVCDGVVNIKQGKMKVKLCIVVEGELVVLLECLCVWKVGQVVYSIYLIVSECGELVSVIVMFRCWVKVCVVVGIEGLQFCDLCVKVVIDKVDLVGDICEVQWQLGYMMVVMIEYYMWQWCGQKIMLIWQEIVL